MPDLLLELFCEEIPARMQPAAADQLKQKLRQALAAARLYDDNSLVDYATPRRLAIHVRNLPEKQPDISEERKGPKVGAPEQAMQGFLKSTGLTLDQLEKRTKGKDEFYFAVTEQKGQPTATALKGMIEGILKAFSWPKSMRWGARDLQWVRPLHNILCIFGGEVVPVEFAHLKANNHTFGHRFMAPERIEITDASQYAELLEKARVEPSFQMRYITIEAECREIAKKHHLKLYEDIGLIQEVTGLVEWPVVLVGSLDKQFMDLPQEVLISEMKNHQKYIPLKEQNGNLAEKFLITSNLTATDGGKAIIHGNERVLRARLEDGRFFWDSDRSTSLEHWANNLQSMVFHAKLGTMADKVARITGLAGKLAVLLNTDQQKAERAAQLCKADLTTGMVGEFPDLQGVMGEYYARAQGEDADIAQAIREHYQPQGPNDACPSAPLSLCVALADKLDTLAGMFAVDEKPTGSKDPFALRRAALGVIRMILENDLRLNMLDILTEHLDSIYEPIKLQANADAVGKSLIEFQGRQVSPIAMNIVAFFSERLKVQLKEESIRPDVIDAIFATDDDDLLRVTARARAVQSFLDTEEGDNLLAAYTRASNIVAREQKGEKTTFPGMGVNISLLHAPEESTLHETLTAIETRIQPLLAAENYAAAMTELAGLRAPLDAFFDQVMVNDENEGLRQNRLHLLSFVRETIDSVAHFSRIQQSSTDKKKAA